MGIFDFFMKESFDKALERAKNTEDSLIIDVREKDEYDFGHIPGSINIPLAKIGSAEFEENAKLFLYCHSGARSAQGCSILKSHGIEAENLGGIAQYRGELEK